MTATGDCWMTSTETPLVASEWTGRAMTMGLSARHYLSRGCEHGRQLGLRAAPYG